MTSLRRLLFAVIAASLLAVAAAGVSGAESVPSVRDPSEFPASDEAEDSPAGFDGTIVNRSFGRGGGAAQGPASQSGRKAKSNPELNTSFEGINLFQHRYSNNQNQLTIEPPDQGLCAGNGYVLEAVNIALNVYDTSGNSVLPPDTNTPPVPHVNGTVALNQFLNYPPAVNRAAANVRTSAPMRTASTSQRTSTTSTGTSSRARTSMRSRSAGSKPVTRATSCSRRRTRCTASPASRSGPRTLRRASIRRAAAAPSTSSARTLPTRRRVPRVATGRAPQTSSACGR